MCKCLNTWRKIYILSYGLKEWHKKEVGSSETSVLTYPHYIYDMICYMI